MVSYPGYPRFSDKHKMDVHQKKVFVLIRFMDLTDLDMLQSGLRRY